MSTLISSSAKEPKIFAAIPGLSGIPSNVIFESIGLNKFHDSGISIEK